VAIAEAIEKACKGLGTDERAIITIVSHRSRKELREVAEAYKVKYGKDIVGVLESETSGWFKKSLVFLFKEALAEKKRMHLPTKLVSSRKDFE